MVSHHSFVLFFFEFWMYLWLVGLSGMCWIKVFSRMFYFLQKFSNKKLCVRVCLGDLQVGVGDCACGSMPVLCVEVWLCVCVCVCEAFKLAWQIRGSQRCASLRLKMWRGSLSLNLVGSGLIMFTPRLYTSLSLSVFLPLSGCRAHLSLCPPPSLCLSYFLLGAIPYCIILVSSSSLLLTACPCLLLS